MSVDFQFDGPLEISRSIHIVCNEGLLERADPLVKGWDKTRIDKVA